MNTAKTLMLIALIMTTVHSDSHAIKNKRKVKAQEKITHDINTAAALLLQLKNSSEKSNSKPTIKYNCLHCLYTTSELRHIKRHVHTHLPEEYKPFSCMHKNCTYTAFAGYSIKQHLSDKHKINPLLRKNFVHTNETKHRNLKNNIISTLYTAHTQG